MFSKKIENRVLDTLIGETTTLEGDLKLQSGLRIEGKVIGDIECEGEVTIGEQGEAVSNISAETIIVAGILKGNAIAKKAVIITATGKVVGHIITQTLVIHEGAKFQGSAEMPETDASKGNGETLTEKESSVHASSP